MESSSGETKLKRASGGEFLKIMSRVEDGLVAFLLMGMILLAVGQIVLRNLLGIGLSWGDPLLRVLVLWVGLLGAVAASRDNKHINIEFLLRFLSGKARQFVQLIVGLVTSGICAMVAYQAVRFVYSDYSAGVKSFGTFPVWLVELILPIAFALLSFRYLLFSVNQFRKVGADEVDN